MKKLIVTLLCLVTLVLSVAVSAEASSPFKSYTYDVDEKTHEAPDAAKSVGFIGGSSEGIGALKDPQDIFLAEDGLLYVADTANNRIAVFSKNGEFIREISEFSTTSGVSRLNSPRGVFVLPDLTVVVADTANKRIVFIKDGALIKEITKPEAELLPETFDFIPLKVTVNNYGQIYVISQGFSMGVLQLAADGEFVSAQGAPDVNLSPLELLWRRFSTKAQLERKQSYIPTEFNNITFDGKSFLYATISAYDKEDFESGSVFPVQCLNAKGADVLIRNGNPSGDYEDVSVSSTYGGLSTIVDCAVLGDGGYAILDQKRGRVFAYNGMGELLYMFGGPGELEGGMVTPTSFAYSDGTYFIADKSKNRIEVFSLTEYGKVYHKLLKAQHDLDYETEEKIWLELKYDNPALDMVFRGLGNAAYRRQDMEQAMHYYKLAGDRENYSKVFTFVRRSWIENNILWLILIITCIVAAVLIYGRLKKKKLATLGKNSYLKTLDFANYVVWHPLAGFYELKKERRGSIKGAVSLLALACLVKVFSDIFTGFIFNQRNLNEYNFLLQVGALLLIFFVWCACQWCVTSLMDGKGTFRDIFIATAYSLMPFIKLTFIATLLSRFMLLNEIEFYNIFITVALLGTIFLIVTGLKQTHDYSMLKTVVVIVIILIVILLLAFIAMLIFALSQQLYVFVLSIYNELTLRV